MMMSLFMVVAQVYFVGALVVFPISPILKSGILLSVGGLWYVLHYSFRGEG